MTSRARAPKAIDDPKINREDLLKHIDKRIAETEAQIKAAETEALKLVESERAKWLTHQAPVWAELAALITAKVAAGEPITLKDIEAIEKPHRAADDNAHFYNCKTFTQPRLVDQPSRSKLLNELKTARDLVASFADDAVTIYMLERADVRLSFRYLITGDQRDNFNFRY